MVDGTLPGGEAGAGAGGGGIEGAAQGLAGPGDGGTEGGDGGNEGFVARTDADLLLSLAQGAAGGVEGGTAGGEGFAVGVVPGDEGSEHCLGLVLGTAKGRKIVIREMKVCPELADGAPGDGFALVGRCGGCGRKGGG